QKDEALPEIGMGELEPRHAVLAEIEKRNKPEEVHYLNNGCAAKDTQRLRLPGRREREHGGTQQNRDGYGVTAIAHFHGEADGRPENGALPGGVPSAEGNHLV